MILLSAICVGIAFTSCQKETVPQTPEAATAENVQSLPPINEGADWDVQLPTRGFYHTYGGDAEQQVFEMLRGYNILSYYPYESGKISIASGAAHGCAGPHSFSAAYCINRHLNNGYPIGARVKHHPSGEITWIMITGRIYGPEHPIIGGPEVYYTYLDPRASTEAAGKDLSTNRLLFDPSGEVNGMYICDETSPRGGRYELVELWSNDGHVGRPFASSNACGMCGNR